MNIINILKGINGEFEITRSLGALGVVIYLIVPNGLIIYHCWYLQKTFDIVAYCAAFPTGLGVAIAAVGITAGVKDRNVAVAKAAASNGSGELPDKDKLP